VESDMVQIDGDDGEELHHEKKYIHVPRILIGNENECVAADIEPGKRNLVSQEKITGDYRNIEDVCEANSFNLEIPNNCNTSVHVYIFFRDEAPLHHHHLFAPYHFPLSTHYSHPCVLH
jgi:hypothetical protein